MSLIDHNINLFNELKCRKQERLEFLYDSGLSVGKSDGGGASASGSGSGFKALEQPSLASSATATATADAKQQSSAPGALFEDKPHSASDAWRKLHSDPLLLIRQREQETLSRLKNNPVKMAMIRKSVCFLLLLHSQLVYVLDLLCRFTFL